MDRKRVAPECRFDADRLKTVNPTITAELLRWWESLSQQQKIWYCELHPNSDLTRGHLGQIRWRLYDRDQMKHYHKKEADSLMWNMMGAVDPDTRRQFAALYRLQLELSE
ncbi:hypothetical protein JCM25156A_14940 [Komagataeibacter kakiaceti JCM 25156]|uniref:hypothetical protein n=1 Tax=Komagataeibacter kakiaceti TaxID=943261 RepID=UPI00047228AD|nr:hypothetical protein [Komagataeibacter kakiaceti]